jgi:uncharacterized Fe-S cluster-containing radical SAM superfamily protein
MPVDTEALAQRYRGFIFDGERRRVLIANLRGTAQELDLSEPANCEGFGRIRHFRRGASIGWPANPLPIDPAQRFLGGPRSDEIRAQVFQNAACNWRCWYCFVPYELLSADPLHSAWLTASELLDLYLAQRDPPRVIDLSGGQPELVPEWILWMIEEIERRELAGKVYLWSDDNLSCDYFWRYLSRAQQEKVASCPGYGRVVCFKGFDEASFAYNTRATGDWFERQFELANRLIKLGIDVYSYVTFTTPSGSGIEDAMRQFIDRLQAIDERLPLRTVPLEVREFSPVLDRMNDVHAASLKHQWIAVEAWQRELSQRFSSEERDRSIIESRFTGALEDQGLSVCR